VKMNPSVIYSQGANFMLFEHIFTPAKAARKTY